MKNYFKGIWASRYFWLHLARADLQYRFRRSKIGLLWTMINPLILMLMISIIFGNIFRVPMNEFAPYVYSGLIVWGFIANSTSGSTYTIIVAETYIKQFKHPHAIYPLKASIVNTALFIISSGGLLVWVLFTKPSNFIITLINIPISAICLFFLGWPLVLLVSYTNLKYRDFSNVLPLLMQLLWYISPVFFSISMFQSANLSFFVDMNPVTHIINLLREPFLYGKFPSFADYGYTLGTSFVLYALAIQRIRKFDKVLVFYF